MKYFIAILLSILFFSSLEAQSKPIKEGDIIPLKPSEVEALIKKGWLSESTLPDGTIQALTCGWSDGGGDQASMSCGGRCFAYGSSDGRNYIGCMMEGQPLSSCCGRDR